MGVPHRGLELWVWGFSKVPLMDLGFRVLGPDSGVYEHLSLRLLGTLSF